VEFEVPTFRKVRERWGTPHLYRPRQGWASPPDLRSTAGVAEQVPGFFVGEVAALGAGGKEVDRAALAVHY